MDKILNIEFHKNYRPNFVKGAIFRHQINNFNYKSKEGVTLFWEIVESTFSDKNIKFYSIITKQDNKIRRTYICKREDKYNWTLWTDKENYNG